MVLYGMGIFVVMVVVYVVSCVVVVSYLFIYDYVCVEGKVKFVV